MYVISDTHGNYEGLMRAMVKAKILDNHGKRQTTEAVVSIGDLVNAVESSIEGDIACLEMLGEEIDTLIVGNHEIPYFDPQNRFGGFHFEAEIANALHNKPVVATLCYGGVLISHAGLSREYGSVFASILTPDKTASKFSELLNSYWDDKSYSHSMFSNCGRSRMGDADVGGILWCDFDDEFEPQDFPQIVGHTPRGVRMKGNSLCIDVGAKNQNTEPFILQITDW